MSDWPKYVSHKVVQAAQIIAFSYDEKFRPEAAIVVYNTDGSMEQEEFRPNLQAQLDGAQVGDWAMKYADGYKSISPAKAFEEGYTPKYLPDEPEATKVSQAAQQVAPNQAATPERTRHVWGPSRLSHGESQCRHCLMTNREAAVLNQMEFCPL